MRRHSYLRKGSYVPPTTGGGSIVITPGEDTLWDCDPSLPLRSLVYISGSNLVDKADASSEDTMTGIGFVASKADSKCSVQYSGELGGFSGLDPGKVYYASSVPGEIWTPTEDNPDFPLVVQVVGKAKTESILLVTVNPGPFILVPPDSI